MVNRIKIDLFGIVQGVGLRPYVWNLAQKYKLGGFIFNNSKGVNLEIEGQKSDLEKFIEEFKALALPLARIEKYNFQKVKPLNEKEFIIKKSHLKTKNDFTLISPDIPTCPDCLKELFDSSDRRLKYPFINCINCGPRFTIICDIPYDRKKITMKEFKMCPLCQGEYDSFLDRRFHAQPNACFICGPHLELINNKGKRIETKDIIKETVELILQGKIIAIKSLGGYHLACDAFNKKTLKTLRERKDREDQPFALMADCVSSIKKFVHVSREEEKILLSKICPIVLLKKNKNCVILEEVAPKQNYLGFMLPYNPLQHLIFKELRKAGEKNPILVMTSGNLHDEPIIYLDDDAKNKIGKISDYFLLNNRSIYMRCDDSIARIFHKNTYLLRRARGIVPEPIFTNKI
ncbi:MAG: Sua5/YciO/YrdC/YwlC family protein, partial [Candidatus Omnitrophota bacterium]